MVLELVFIGGGESAVILCDLQLCTIISHN